MFNLNPVKMKICSIFNTMKRIKLNKTKCEHCNKYTLFNKIHYYINHHSFLKAIDDFMNRQPFYN